MSQATISIRVDQALKRSFDSLCETFGLTTTAAFNIFMRTVVRERKIPFEIKADSGEEKKKKALDALRALQLAAEEAEINELSLEDINREIKAVRNERNTNITGF